MGFWKIFPGASPRTPVFCSLHLCFFSAPQYEIRSNSHTKFFQATAKSNVLSTFCSLSVFLMALLFFFFPQIIGRSMHLCCSMYLVIIIISAMERGAQSCKCSPFRTQILLGCFVVNHLGVQLTSQPKISGMHLPYFPYWLPDTGLTGEVNFSHCLYETVYFTCRPWCREVRWKKVSLL